MKNIVVSFGSGDPRTNTGLSPTFLTFVSAPGGSSITAPSITEIPSGTGAYAFGYTASTFPIYFLLDGGSSLSSGDRYINGILDPLAAVDEKVGATWDSYGTTATDPTTVLAFAKRIQEVLEGPATFAKSTGLWTVLSRGASSIALFSRTLTNLSGSVTKS